jgi:hypothetical protein
MIYALSLGVMAVVAIVIWYFFMLPLGKERHERELELIRRKLAKREENRDSGTDTFSDRASS